MSTSFGVLQTQINVWRRTRIQRECSYGFSYLDCANTVAFRPPWKLFAFTFWGSKPFDQKYHANSEPYSFNPLGSEWNIVSVLKFEFNSCFWLILFQSISSMSFISWGSHFLMLLRCQRSSSSCMWFIPVTFPLQLLDRGYHFEGCKSLKYVPFQDRKKEIIVLAKRAESWLFESWTTEKLVLVSNYYYRSKYDHETFYARLRNHTGLDIISNAHEEEGYPIPEGLRSVGYLPQYEYDLTLVSRAFRRHCLIIIVWFQASAKAVFGIGQPMISPTPYASLCRGYVFSELLDHVPNCYAQEFRLFYPMMVNLCSKKPTRPVGRDLVPMNGVASWI